MLAVMGCSAERGYRHFFYGATEATLHLLTTNIKQRFPGVEIVGTYVPPFTPLSPEEDEAVIAKINASNADIIWVGLSTPKQERWMAEHHSRLNAPVLIGVGAAFELLCRNRAAGTAHYSTQRTGMSIPPHQRATSALETVPAQQSRVRAVHRAAEGRNSNIFARLSMRLHRLQTGSEKESSNR
jgi:hypothetical protein